MADMPVLSLLLAVPAILVSLWMCLMTADKQLSENKMILWWLIANTNWMIAEKFETHTYWLAYIFFGIGIIEMTKREKTAKNRKRMAKQTIKEQQKKGNYKKKS